MPPNTNKQHRLIAEFISFEHNTHPCGYYSILWDRIKWAKSLYAHKWDATDPP